MRKVLLNTIIVFSLLMIVAPLLLSGQAPIQDGEYKEIRANGTVDTITTYKSGKKHGPFKDFTTKGNLYSEGNYVSGGKEGLWKIYDWENPYLKEEKFYKNKELLWKKSYTSTGKLVHETNYKYFKNKQKKHGLERSWHYKNGQLDYEKKWNQGKMADGSYTRYFENGGIKEVKTYKKGELSGEAITYSEKGKVIKKHRYNNGKIADGTYEEYFSDTGSIHNKVSYKNGKKDGVYKKFNKNGSVSDLINYKNGKLHGKKIRYQKNGDIAFEYDYIDDKPVDGTYKEYWAGHLTRELTYKNGELEGVVKKYKSVSGSKTYYLSKLEYYKSGKKHGDSVKYYKKKGKEPTVTSKYTYENDKIADGTYKEYNESGEVYKELTYKNGKKHGKEIRYSQKIVKSVENYENGKKHGEQKHYAFNGQLMSLAHYYQGTRYPEHERYYDNGKPKEIIIYNGKHSYNLKRYDKTGKLTFEETKIYNTRKNLEKTKAKSHIQKAIALKKKKKYKEAILELETALSIKPDYAWAYSIKGLCHNGLKQYENAVTSFSKAIELSPKFQIVYRNRAFTHKKLKLYDKAIADYSKAIDLKPKDSWAYFFRANTYFDLGKKDNAKKDYQNAARLNPKKLGYNTETGKGFKIKN